MQESKESVIKIAKKYNINSKTVQSTKGTLSNLTVCFSVSLKNLHELDSHNSGHESEAHSIVKWRHRNSVSDRILRNIKLRSSLLFSIT